MHVEMVDDSNMRTPILISVLGGLLAVPFNIYFHLADMGGFVPGYGPTAVGALGVFGLVCSAVVIFSALMADKRPERHAVWGALIVVFGGLSLLGSVAWTPTMGGGGLNPGSVWSVIGGILIAMRKPSAQ